MKKTLLRTAMLAAIASLAMSGYAFAHHPLSVMDPDLYDRIDDILAETNSNHNEVVGDVEDYTFMGQVEDNAAVDTPTNQSQAVEQDGAGETSSTMSVNQGGTGAQAGGGSGSMSRN